MEAESCKVFPVHSFRVLVAVEPPFAGEGILQLVPVVFGLVGTDDRGYLRHVQMPYAHKLVIDLLLLGFELQFVWKRLPFASSAYSEVRAERFEPVRGWLHYFCDEAFHIVLLFLEDLHVDDVARHGELYEEYCSIYVGQGFSFCCNCFNDNVFESYILFFL